MKNKVIKILNVDYKGKKLEFLEKKNNLESLIME